MRRGEGACFALAAVLLLAGLAWGGAWLIRQRSPLRRTAVCRSYTLERRAELEGAVIRQETPLTDEKLFRRIVALPGQRVGAGDVLAVGYDSGGEYFRTALLLRLRRELALRDAAEARTEAGLPPRGDSRALAAGLSAALARQDFAAVTEAALAGSLAISGADNGEALRTGLKTEIASLAAAGAEDGLLTAPAAGFFWPVTDGWESLFPGELDPDGLPFVPGEDFPSGAWGRLVTGSLWLLAAVVPPEAAGSFLPGAALTVTPPEGGALTGEVLSLRDTATGTLAVLGFRTGLEKVLELRQGRFSVLLERQSGWLLPSAAVREADGEFFVCRAAGPFVRRESVKVLCSLGDETLVAAEGLREGSLVLTGENTPADGALLP